MIEGYAMADKDCEEACIQAYQESVKNCYRVLFEGLAAAKTDPEREKARDRFKLCMRLCKDTRKACLEACDGS
jgi:hypothetical protein